MDLLSCNKFARAWSQSIRLDYSVICNIPWVDRYLTMISEMQIDVNRRKSKFIDKIYQINWLCYFFSSFSRRRSSLAVLVWNCFIVSNYYITPIEISFMSINGEKCAFANELDFFVLSVSPIFIAIIILFVHSKELSC